MNSQDWHEGMVRNQEWEVKRQAKLDALYERERAKYYSAPTVSSTPAPVYQAPVVNTPTTSSEAEYFKGSSNVPVSTSDINARLNRIEARIDKLYEMIAVKPNNNTSDKLFVIASNDTTVFSNQAFTLTDDQFNALMSKIVNS